MRRFDTDRAAASVRSCRWRSDHRTAYSGRKLPRLTGPTCGRSRPSIPGPAPDIGSASGDASEERRSTIAQADKVAVNLGVLRSGLAAARAARRADYRLRRRPPECDGRYRGGYQAPAADLIADRHQRRAGAQRRNAYAGASPASNPLEVHHLFSMLMPWRHPPRRPAGGTA